MSDKWRVAICPVCAEEDPHTVTWAAWEPFNDDPETPWWCGGTWEQAMRVANETVLEDQEP